jgi:aspartate/methionine/tyrosine aminotransferase
MDCHHRISSDLEKAAVSTLETTKTIESACVCVSDRSIEEYCVGLAERERIMLVPASVYGSHYAEGGHFRVGFGRKDMTEVLALFEAALTERSAGGTTGAK